MLRDGMLWAVGSIAFQVLEPDPSVVGFIRNAGMVGGVIATGWIVEARIGKKIGSAITHHTQIEEQRLAVVKAEVAGQMGVLLTELKGLHEKLDTRPCAAPCRHGDHR